MESSKKLATLYNSVIRAKLLDITSVTPPPHTKNSLKIFAKFNDLLTVAPRQKKLPCIMNPIFVYTLKTGHLAFL